MLDISGCKFLEKLQVRRSACSIKSYQKVGKSFLVCKLLSQINGYTVKADYLHLFQDKTKTG